MAVLEVVKAGHPILKEVAEPVEHVNKKMRALIEDMADTMYKTEGGSGLIALINPEIIHGEGSQIGLEGCLSVPGYFGDVERFEKVTVTGIDPHNKKVMIKAEGFLARIFQHEIDHLEGHLFIEKATNLRRIADHPEEKEIV